MARSDPLGLVGASLAGLLAACQTTASDAPSLPAPVGRAAPAVSSQAWPPIDWTQAADCQAKLGLLTDAARDGRLNADERPPIAAVLPGASDRRDWLAAPSVTIATDLPLEVHERTDPAIRDTPCLLLVEPARDQRVGQRLISQDSVRSLYQSSVRTERNPDYDVAQLRLRKAERAAKKDGPGILKVGDPLLDLMGLLIGGVISGFSEGSRERELDEATAALSAIPRSIDHPLYRAYQFERQVVLAGKEATIPVALVDRAHGRIWRAQLRQRERREFEILEGLDPRDKDYQTHATGSLTRHDFDRWQREPPRLQLSAIAAALREAAPAPASDRLLAAVESPESSAGTREPLPQAAGLDLGRDPAPPPRPGRIPPTPDRFDVDDRMALPDSPDGPLAATNARDEPRVAAAEGSEPLAEPLADPVESAPIALARLRPGRANRPASRDVDGRLHAAFRPGASGFEQAPGAGPAAPLGRDPRAASVVRVGAGARSGGGVYVRSDLVLTTTPLVDGSSVVDVATADGARVLGLVARVDRARKLALIQVAHPGPPVAFYDGPPIQPGRPVEAIALAERTGVVLTPGRYQSDHALPGVADPAFAELAQVDVGVPPAQPEGLPWFLGDQVVGVGSGAADESAEGSLIAVRAREVLDFLYGAGGALAALP